MGFNSGFKGLISKRRTVGKVQEFNDFKRDITSSESYNRNSNV